MFNDRVLPASFRKPTSALLDRTHPVNRNLYGAWLFGESAAYANDYGPRGLRIALTNSPAFAVSHHTSGMANSFDGTNDYGSVAIDLSTTNILTVAFWLNWTTFANDDKFAMEYSTNFNSNAGFYVDPNSGAPASGTFSFGAHTAGGYYTNNFTRPSAGAWHHYVLYMPTTTNVGTAAAWVDGVSQSLSVTTGGATGSANYGNFTLYIMSRAGSSLFGAGVMEGLRIWGGLPTPTMNEVMLLYREPWCGFLETPRFYIANTVAAASGKAPPPYQRTLRFLPRKVA